MSEDELGVSTVDYDDLPEERIDGRRYKDVPRIVWVRVQDAADRLLVGNLKQHDIGGVVESLEKYGLQELPKYDNGVGIKAGNGRVTALSMMEAAGDREPPRGVVKNEAGDWVMPLLVGVDAESVAVAKAYAIDSNNLTVTGSDLRTLDIAGLYDMAAYTRFLTELSAENGEMPVSVDGEDFLLILEQMSKRDAEPMFSEETTGGLGSTGGGEDDLSLTLSFTDESREEFQLLYVAMADYFGTTEVTQVILESMRLASEVK